MDRTTGRGGCQRAERPGAGVAHQHRSGKNVFHLCQLDLVFRFNTAWGWGEREEQGVKRLGELIREQLS